jgi:hypothetical protein
VLQLIDNTTHTQEKSLYVTLRSAYSAEAAAKAGSDASSILHSRTTAEDGSVLRSTTKDESLRSTSVKRIRDLRIS